MHPFYNAVENELLGLLVKGGVRFVVIGGAAVQYHGVERAREDLDLLLEATPENATRFVGALQQSRYRIEPEHIERIASAGLQIHICGTDILTSAAGLDASEAIDTGLPVHFDGGVLKVLSMANLVAAKRARGEPKDYSDLEALGLPPTPSTLTRV